MRFRKLALAVVALLAVAGLAGCRTTIGTAAVVNGERITDTQVTNSITPSAKPVQISQSASQAPRPFVVQILVRLKLFRAIAANAPDGAPSQTQLAALSRRVLNGKTPAAFAKAQQITGYSASFDRTLVDYVAYLQVLRNYSTNGVDLNKLIASTKMSVQLSPRYGAWQRSQLGLSSSPSAGLPGFISLQPTSAPGAGTQVVPVPDN